MSNLTISQLKKLLETLPAYYDNMPVAVSVNKFGGGTVGPLAATGATPVEEYVSTKLVSNGLLIEVDLPKPTKKEEKKS
jgi:hypothetical protein